MAQLISISIDVTKITKERLYQGQKGKYLKLTVSVNDEEDQFGNTVSAYEEQTKEERENKAPKNFLGNGKVIWSSAGGTVSNAIPKAATQPAPAASSGDEDGLPF